MHNLYKLESESSVKYPTSVQCGPSYFRFNSKIEMVQEEVLGIPAIAIGIITPVVYQTF